MSPRWLDPLLLRSIPAVVFPAALPFLGRRELVAQAGDLQLECESSEQGRFVRAQLRHRPSFVIICCALGELEYLPDFLASAAQAGQPNDFFFPRCEF